MSETWIISDTHFNHNKDFILQPRNFSTVEEMNEKIIERWNSVVQPNDTIYHLGDMTMGDIDAAVPLIARLNGKINLAIGNHDTNARLKTFGWLSNITDIQFGYRLKIGKYTYLLTHYPQLTGNYDESKTFEEVFYNIPLDYLDGAMRVLQPIIEGVNNKNYLYGIILKDYKEYHW